MLYASDVQVRSVGIVHAILEANDDFYIVGTSPTGTTPKIKRGDPVKLAPVRVSSVAIPKDALAGGPLTTFLEKGFLAESKALQQAIQLII